MDLSEKFEEFLKKRSIFEEIRGRIIISQPLPTAPILMRAVDSGQCSTAAKTAVDRSPIGSGTTPNVKTAAKTAASRSGNGSGLTSFRQTSGFHVQVWGI